MYDSGHTEQMYSTAKGRGKGGRGAGGGAVDKVAASYQIIEYQYHTPFLSCQKLSTAPAPVSHPAAMLALPLMCFE